MTQNLIDKVDKCMGISCEPVPHTNYSESSSKHYGDVGDYSTTIKHNACKVAYV